MGRKVLCALLTAVLSLQLCGCGDGEFPFLDNRKEESTEASDSFVSSLDASDIAALSLKDNSLDAYSAVLNTPLRVDSPKGAMKGGLVSIYLGNSRAFYLKKHLSENSSENWDELSIVTEEGKSWSERWNWGVNWDWNSQMWEMGGISGKDHILGRTIAYLDGVGYQNRLIEMDEDMNILREISVEFLDGEQIEGINQLVADKEGYIHFSLSRDDKRHYCVLSSDGALLADYSMDDFAAELVSLYDGRIAVATEAEEGRWVLLILNMASRALEQLVVLDKSPSGKGVCFLLTLFDENTLLWADNDGIYRSDLQGNVFEPLYLWKNHGMMVSGIDDLRILEEGRISLIYSSNGERSYLCLEPTTEEVEIRRITLAVSPQMESVYNNMATEFNKRYPACHIDVKSNYDETALLTELIAGKGPVLVDTSLTGFATQERLWEPLDEIIRQMGLTEELQSAALELGKINGTQYGVVKDFYLETVVIDNQELKSWDYDTFLQCILDVPGVEAVFNSYSLEQDGFRFVSDFFVHGMEDSYLFDAESGSTSFDSKNFRNILKLAKEYCVRKEMVPPGNLLPQGNVLCNTLNIHKPEQIALYRLYYGENINYIGYPVGEGYGNYINSSAPLAIRRTASTEDKVAACIFLQMILSYECQKKAADDVNFSLSVRKDVLEEQINSVDENSIPTALGFDQIRLGEEVNNALDAKILYSLLDKSQPYRELPQELNSILYEELQQYFYGTISEDAVIEHLKNRVGLYLKEQQ